MKVGAQRKFTIWTASASNDVPALVQLDMHVPPAGVSEAKERAAAARVRTLARLKSFVSRPTSESLRKFVK